MAAPSAHDTTKEDELRQRIIDDERSYANVGFGSEIRHAELYTEIYVGDQKFDFVSTLGARSCSTNALTLDQARGSLVYSLACDLTYFHVKDSPLGPITIIDDPRREITGSIILRRTGRKDFQLPGLSYFNQYLIFHVGDSFFYYPSPWQVVSAITEWPPEGHQYHHLEDNTPIFDFNTRQPNVARKGISTIKILHTPSSDQEAEIREAHAREVEIVKQQPGYRVPPEEFLSTPPESGV